MHNPENPDPVVEANARLTGSTGIVLLIPLAIVWVTGLVIRTLLVPHVLVGFLQVPPVLLKLAGVGYRFIRYYLVRDPRYRAAGPPRLVLLLRDRYWSCSRWSFSPAASSSGCSATASVSDGCRCIMPRRTCGS
jgi:hypothetical protein